MIIGLGTDIVNINRIKTVIDRWGDKFLKRIFTSREIEYCRSQSNPAPHYAARFSAKEAVFKVLGTGWRKLQWRELEIINDTLGKPELKLRGKAEIVAENLSIQRIHVSLSHEKNYAVAQAVAEGGIVDDST